VLPTLDKIFLLVFHQNILPAVDTFFTDPANLVEEKYKIDKELYAFFKHTSLCQFYSEPIFFVGLFWAMWPKFGQLKKPASGCLRRRQLIKFWPKFSQALSSQLLIINCGGISVQYL
jgi:hypothetical protein